jgi:hypothetical protein
MSKPNDGGYAYPRPLPDIQAPPDECLRIIREHGGMTLRQWYAGTALSGIMANPERWKQLAADYVSGKKTYEQCSEANAAKALSLADAMIRAEGGES